jgi:hypothetical protein
MKFFQRRAITGRSSKSISIKLIYDSTVTTIGPKWTNGLISSFDLKLGFTRNLEFMAF